MPSLEDLALEIEEISKGRFELQRDSETIDEILLSLNEGLMSRAALRLRRNSNKTGGWRTILFVSLSDKSGLVNVIKWAAECRDILSEPEASDLYLFIDAIDCGLSLEESTKIESSEQFCRKYVTRPDEKFSDLLKRSFLCPLSGGGLHTNITDPLIDAFKSTGLENRWFNEAEQLQWRDAFLSGESGSDLADTLLDSAINLSDV